MARASESLAHQGESFAYLGPPAGEVRRAGFLLPYFFAAAHSPRWDTLTPAAAASQALP